MTELQYIKHKQKIWAEDNNISLIGSQNNRGEKIYTSSLDNNLFQPLSNATRNDINNGNGNELGNGIIPGKMQALHSSSAIAVNVFEYWRHNNDKKPLAKSLGISGSNITSVCFEKKHPVFNNHGGTPPNIDVEIIYKNGDCCAIECKFTEPFNNRGSSHDLNDKYIQKLKHYNFLTNLEYLATKIKLGNSGYELLNCSQLIKHILGLLNTYDGSIDRFTLIYLYYDVFGENGYKHNMEIHKFSDILKNDGIRFKAITWQELIYGMSTKINIGDPQYNYIHYIRQRYL